MADENYNMTDVESGNLQSVGFDPETKTGKVVFVSGWEYLYFGCTQEECDSIISASSANTAFQQIWRGKQYRRIA